MTKARTNADNYAADITGVTAGTGITGGGTSGTVTVTNELVTTIDAAGDLLYGTGSDAAARLGIGTAGQVLQVNSGATAPEWVAPTAGGFSQLATGSLSGAAVTISSISASFKDLVLVVTNWSAVTTANVFGFRINNVTSGYGSTRLVSQTSTLTNQGSQSTFRKGNDGYNSPVAASDRIIRLTIPNYSLANTEKYLFSTFSEDTAAGFSIGHSTETAVVDRIDIVVTSGGDFDGGTYTLFGVN